jgi:pre-mRNA-processing factor 17
VGHTAAVRQVAFGTTGAEFLSCSYDRHVKAWDAESGACIGDYTNDKVPYCVTWHPEDPNIFIVGSANRKMVQYDRRTGGIALEYNYHLGAVNTVTFVDAGRRIVSTSDDKKVLVWEYNAPVPIKYIADPSMQAIPSVTPHPSGEFIACQSMDNSIQVYFAGERGVSLNRKKRFAGHVTAGYACQIGISPDGHHIASGDGDGQVWFWDWRSGRFNKKVRAHEGGPAIGCVWHPLRPTMMATCGWDGIIKLWE